MHRGDRQQPLGCKAEGIETGAARAAAFGERQVLDDPAEAGAPARRQPQREAGRRGKMRLARRGDLMQRAAGKPAAKRRVDAGDAERKAARLAVKGSGFFQGAQTVA